MKGRGQRAAHATRLRPGVYSCPDCAAVSSARDRLSSGACLWERIGQCEVAGFVRVRVGARQCVHSERRKVPLPRLGRCASQGRTLSLPPAAGGLRRKSESRWRRESAPGENRSAGRFGANVSVCRRGPSASLRSENSECQWSADLPRRSCLDFSLLSGGGRFWEIGGEDIV